MGKDQRKGFVTLLLMVALFTTISFPSRSPAAPIYSNWNVSLEGLWPCGSMYRIAGRSDTVYFNAGRTLSSLDFTDPLNPVLLGSYDLSNHMLTSMLLLKNLLYKTDDSGNFSILNVIDPTDPYLVGELNLGNELRDIDIVGDAAFVATYDGLSIVDISNPTSPSEIAHFGISMNANAILVDGTFAYIGTADSGLKVVDVSTITAPNEAASCDISGEISDIAISGIYAFIVTQMDSLMVIDISDPYNPARIGAAFTIDEPVDVKIVGDYAYVAATWAGFLVYDISTPQNPVLVNTIPTEGFPVSLAVDGNKIYISCEREGVILFDITDPANPSRVGEYGVGYNPWATAVQDTLAFVSDQMYWFRIVDVSNHDNPIEKGSIRFGGTIEDLAADGDYVFTVGDSFRVVDCTDITSPKLAAKFPIGGRGIELNGGYAYIATYSTLDIFSISDPANPSYTGRYTPGSSVYDVAVSGNHAYLACAFGGITIVDVSNPASPSLVTTYATPGSAVGVAVSGNLLLVADSGDGLRIIDISEPGSPVEVGVFDNGGNISEVAADGHRAFVVDGQSALRVVDFSTPSNPVEVGYFISYGYMHGAPVVAGDIVFQTDYSYGIGILNCYEAVSTLLEQMTARFKADCIEVQWTLSLEEGITSFLIIRSTQDGGKGLKVAEIDADGESTYSFIDRDIAPGMKYIYTLYAVKEDGSRTLLGKRTVSTGNLPGTTLMQNYPNPFNPLTTISFYIPEDADVELSVFDVSGRHIKTIVRGKLDAGTKRVLWDGTNVRGELVGSGVYLYRLRVGKETLTRRMVLLR